MQFNAVRINLAMEVDEVDGKQGKGGSFRTFLTVKRGPKPRNHFNCDTFWPLVRPPLVNHQKKGIKCGAWNMGAPVRVCITGLGEILYRNLFCNQLSKKSGELLD
jgi:hypothetical protein